MEYKDLIISLCLGISIFIVSHVFLFFLEVRKQMKITYRKKCLISSIFSYPYFSISRIISILISTHSITFMSIFFSYINTYLDGNWGFKVIICIMCTSLNVGLSLILGTIQLDTMYGKQDTSDESKRKPGAIVITYWNTKKEYFEQTLYDLILNKQTTLIYPIKKNEGIHKTGDLIFYAEGMSDSPTGRWILLKIISIAKDHDMLEMKAVPCRIVSDGTFTIEDEMKNCMEETENNEYITFINKKNT